MSTQKEEAEVLRKSLLLGLASVDEVVAWADAQIAQAQTPHPVLLELALSQRAHPLDLCGLLAQVPGAAAKEHVGRQIFRRMVECLDRDESAAPTVAYGLYEMALAGEAPSEEAERRMWYFDEAFSLARRGICGTVEQVTAELRDFLRGELPPPQAA
jgi:hypothetical protein